MKSKEEIEQLAFLKYPRLINDPYIPIEDDNADERKIWIDGYTQCQEDMAIEITELKMICQEYSKDVKALNDMLSSIVLHPQTWS